MIYTVQMNSFNEEYKVIYAGSSAHQALVAASKLNTCKISLFKDGKRFMVSAPINEQKP